MRKIKILLFLFIIVIGAGYIFWPNKQVHSEPTNTTLLSPDQVFKVSARLADTKEVLLSFEIAPDFYIYTQRLKIKAIPENAILASQIKWPHTLLIPDINDPAKMDEVYTGSFVVKIPLDTNNKIDSLKITLQGCDGKSICYPPKDYNFKLSGAESSLTSNNTSGSFSSKFLQFYHGEISGQVLLSGFSFIQLVLVFFLAGIGISLTPCMYPLYPIALATIIGNSNKARRHITLLVIIYIHGMALVYVLMGFFAALTGRLFTSEIQTPLVMILSGAIWFLLGISMFDIIEIKLPNRLNAYLHHKSHTISGGKYTKVFLMGILSSILLGPCVTPPLIAAIGFIVGKADVFFGGISLYAICLGMGIPILVLALLGDRLLPRSGRWMIGVKYFLGAVMIAGSLYLVMPFMYNYYFAKPVPTNITHVAGMVDTKQQLDAIINSSDKPVIVDFYASWCSVCTEMEAKTFINKDVRKVMGNYTVIKFDVTKNTQDQEDVMHRYGLYGPPAIIVISKNKQVTNKLVGFISAKDLIRYLTNGQ